MAEEDLTLPEQPEDNFVDTLQDKQSQEEQGQMQKQDEAAQRDPLVDPFICPDDEFLQRVWPPMRSLANLRDASTNIAEEDKRIPLKDFDQNVTTSYCMGCRLVFKVKGHYFWPTDSYIGRIHLY